MSVLSFLGSKVDELRHQSVPKLLKSVFIDPQKAVVRDVIQGTVKAVDTAVRSGAKAGVDVGNKVRRAAGREAVDYPSIAKDVQKPTGIMHFLEGNQPVETLQTSSAGSAAALEKGNADIFPGAHKFSPGVAKPLGFLGSAGILASNFIPGGEEASVAKNIGKDAVESLAKATTVGAVKTILKGKYADDVIDKVAPSIARTKDTNIVSNLLRDQPRLVQEVANPARREINSINESRAKLEAGGATAPELRDNTRALEDATKRYHQETQPVRDITPGVSPTHPTGNAFDEILGAVRGEPATRGKSPVQGLASKVSEQEKLLSQERGARFARSAEAGKVTEGSKGYFAEKSALSGQYGKVDYSPLIDDIGPQRAEELFTNARRQIQETPDSVYEEMGLHPGGARLNTQTAVRKVLGLEPGLPTRSELKLLAVHSPKMAEEIKATLPIHRKIFDAASALFANSRSAKSTLDLSMGGRQGLFVAARHPVLWARANIESIKYAKNPEYYINEMKAIHGDDFGQLIDKVNPHVLTGGLSHEESFPGLDIVGKVPGVKGAERAYTGGLTRLRKDTIVKALSAYGDTAEEVERTLGKDGVAGVIEAVSTLTGRGGKAGGWVEKHATTLQEALFSPRLWASRLQPLNLAYWARLGPAGRKEAIQNYGAFAAVAGIVLTAAVASGAEVETDPRSSDFLKIKVGDTRYDILGGFQQNLVFLARQISGSTKSSSTGAVTKYGDKFGGPTRLSAAFDLVRGKSTPVLSSGANLLEGKDKAGNKINPLTEIGQLFVPISIQGSYHAVQQEGVKGLAKNTPDFVGIGTQTYGVKDVNISDKQKEYVKSLQNGGKTKEQVEANKSFFQVKKSGPSRTNASDAINAALEKGGVTKAKQLAADYNKKYAANFTKWAKQYGKYSDKILLKQYKAGKINLTPANIKTRVKAIRSPL